MYAIMPQAVISHVSLSPKKKKAPRHSIVSTTKSNRNHGKQFETEEGEAEGLPGRRINEDHYRKLNKHTDCSQKPKLKVGKAKAKPENFTDTSFRSKGMLLGIFTGLLCSILTHS